MWVLWLCDYFVWYLKVLDFILCYLCKRIVWFIMLFLFIIIYWKEDICWHLYFLVSTITIDKLIIKIQNKIMNMFFIVKKIVYQIWCILEISRYWQVLSFINCYLCKSVVWLEKPFFFFCLLEKKLSGFSKFIIYRREEIWWQLYFIIRREENICPAFHSKSAFHFLYNHNNLLNNY